MPVNSKIQVRKGIASDWNSANPVLASGEPGYDTTNGGLKIGNGSLSWNQLNYVGVLGTGTTNFITKFTANQNLGNSLIFDNGTNVGIGTTSPNELLEVNGHLRLSDIAGTQRNVIQLSRGGGGRFDYSLGLYGTALAISTSNDGSTQRHIQFGFHDGSNIFQPKTTINGFNGNVGIGTSAPTVALDVRGASIFNESGGDFDFRVEGDTDANLLFVDANTDRVGIGTSTPSYKLNVNPASDSNNGIQILNNSAGTSARSLLSLFNGSYGAEISVGGTGFTNNEFYRTNRLLISGPFITDYVTGQHIFSIGGGGTAQAVSGSTQIGVWNINALTVQNELRPIVGIAGGTLAASSLSLKSTIGVGTTDHIKLLVGNNGATEAVRVINNGNVGIGTTTPTYKLQVNGSFAASIKSFRIEHPSRPNYSLEYGSLESPYHGVRLTGRGVVVKGVGTVTLPNYLKDLIHDDENINIQITNIKHGKTIYVDNIDLNNDRFSVRADRAKTLGDLEFFWVFTGVRKDVDRLVVERKK